MTIMINVMHILNFKNEYLKVNFKYGYLKGKHYIQIILINYDHKFTRKDY